MQWSCCTKVSIDNIMGYFAVNDTLRMYKNDDIRMYNFNCITDTIVEVITTCNTYTLLTVHYCNIIIRLTIIKGHSGGLQFET